MTFLNQGCTDTTEVTRGAIKKKVLKSGNVQNFLDPPLKHEDDLKNKESLKIEDDLKNKDDLKDNGILNYEDDLRNEDDLKTKDDLIMKTTSKRKTI